MSWHNEQPQKISKGRTDENFFPRKLALSHSVSDLLLQAARSPVKSQEVMEG